MSVLALVPRVESDEISFLNLLTRWSPRPIAGSRDVFVLGSLEVVCSVSLLGRRMRLTPLCSVLENTRTPSINEKNET
ncbi:hypothetical protein RSSM_03774 [Rhodopirellula sallentina SM41]|uniref:Uncharacterized protein n=1 Tax=Rhodopirellula sallentina SM41 TaxID=1263870 RepID=M5U027_9BACT|nr:hypothetical protein RSSM_03774 [Rhodopirellula sallentina SM41]